MSERLSLTKRLEATIGAASWPPGMLDDFPEDEIRAVIESGRAGEFEPVLRAHLHGLELARAQRALDAAERSARASERAARYAMYAAILSAVGLVVALALN